MQDRNIIFHNSAPFVPLSDEDGILNANGTDWFVVLLKQIPALNVYDVCQEDWGVIFFVEHEKRKYFIGLGFYAEDEWLTFVQHMRWGWFKKYNAACRNELIRLTEDLRKVVGGVFEDSVI